MSKNAVQLAAGLQHAWDLQLEYKGQYMDAALARGDLDDAAAWAEALMENAAARDAQIADVLADNPIPGVTGTLPGYGGGPGQDWS